MFAHKSGRSDQPLRGDFSTGLKMTSFIPLFRANRITINRPRAKVARTIGDNPL